MDKAFFLPHFEKMDTPEKTTRMQALAKRYDLLFQGLQTFSRWGQSCTTGVFERLCDWPGHVVWQQYVFDRHYLHHPRAVAG